MPNPVSGSQRWDIPYAALKVNREIGRGGFGVVYDGTWRTTPVAVKVMNQTAMTPSDIQNFVAEIELMKAIRPHANVLQLIGICQSPLCIVTEFMPFGSLHAFLRSDAQMDKHLIHKIVHGIARGMLHLHLENVVHRDLAARNILLTGSLDPKISDFGLSRVNLKDNSNVTRSNVGPLKWMAPECITDSIYGTKSDVWAFGITVIEILTREDPYPGQEPLNVAAKVAQGTLQPAIPSNASPFYAQLLKSSVCFSAEQRIGFEQISEQLSSQE